MEGGGSKGGDLAHGWVLRISRSSDTTVVKGGMLIIGKFIFGKER